MKIHCNSAKKQFPVIWLLFFLPLLCLSAQGFGSITGLPLHTLYEGPIDTIPGPPTEYPFFWHMKTGNPPPKIGEYVFFHQQIRIKDSIIHSSRMYKSEPYHHIRPNWPVSPAGTTLTYMGKGDSATVVVRIDTLDCGRTCFKGTKELLIDLVVVDILTEEEFHIRRREKERKGRVDKAEAQKKVEAFLEGYRTGAFERQLQKADSGIEYLILEKGAGKKAGFGDQVVFHYYVTSSDKKYEGNSFDIGDRTPRVYFPGYKYSPIGIGEAAPLLKEEDKAIMVIPPEIVLKESRLYSPEAFNSTLIYYIELLSVIDFPEK